MNSPFILEREQVLPRPRAEVFSFFARPENLEAITPPSLRFQIMTPSPVRMAEGSLIDYRIRVSGVPLRWRSLIEVYEPPCCFVDLQLRGPYALWRHAHTFEDCGEGTRIVDRVQYALPLGAMGRLAHALWVRRTLERIFDFRKEAVAGLFGISPS
jgi:ligand-binding SRPBCC domain-containing protein